MRLLLVEDDEMIGESMRAGMRLDGFVVDWVSDGIAAELALRNKVYDAILLDLGLPRKDGLEVLKALRQRKDTTPCLIVTARDSIPGRIAGLDCGADDYIVKPFDLNELSARIRAVLRRQSGRAESVIHAGALTLNPSTHEVRLEGRPLPVSSREFSLLEVFMTRPGVVYSRDQLEEKLYGWGDEIQSNTVEVYIHSLRKNSAKASSRTYEALDTCCRANHDVYTRAAIGLVAGGPLGVHGTGELGRVYEGTPGGAANL